MSDSNPDVRNPYVWEEPSFGPLSHALLEYRLYIGASRLLAEPQFEPRRKESLRLGSNRGDRRGVFWATISRFVGTQTLY